MIMNTVANKTEQPQQQRRDECFSTPEVNIWENQDNYVVEAEMPGVSKEGLEITLEGSELTLTGRRSYEAPLPGHTVYRESRQAGYRRVFELDPMIDIGKIKAQMNQGILTLTLPKQEKVKPRKITID